MSLPSKNVSSSMWTGHRSISPLPRRASPESGLCLQTEGRMSDQFESFLESANLDYSYRPTPFNIEMANTFGNGMERINIMSLNQSGAQTSDLKTPRRSRLGESSFMGTNHPSHNISEQADKVTKSFSAGSPSHLQTSRNVFPFASQTMSSQIIANNQTHSVTSRAFPLSGQDWRTRDTGFNEGHDYVNGRGAWSTPQKSSWRSQTQLGLSSSSNNFVASIGNSGSFDNQRASESSRVDGLSQNIAPFVKVESSQSHEIHVGGRKDDPLNKEVSYLLPVAHPHPAAPSTQGIHQAGTQPTPPKKKKLVKDMTRAEKCQHKRAKITENIAKRSGYNEAQKAMLKKLNTRRDANGVVSARPGAPMINLPREYDYLKNLLDEDMIAEIEKPISKAQVALEDHIDMLPRFFTRWGSTFGDQRAIRGKSDEVKRAFIRALRGNGRELFEGLVRSKLANEATSADTRERRSMRHHVKDEPFDDIVGLGKVPQMVPRNHQQRMNESPGHNSAWLDQAPKREIPYENLSASTFSHPYRGHTARTSSDFVFDYGPPTQTAVERRNFNNISNSSHGSGNQLPQVPNWQHEVVETDNFTGSEGADFLSSTIHPITSNPSNTLHPRKMPKYSNVQTRRCVDTAHTPPKLQIPYPPPTSTTQQSSHLQEHIDESHHPTTTNDEDAPPKSPPDDIVYDDLALWSAVRHQANLIIHPLDNKICSGKSLTEAESQARNFLLRAIDGELSIPNWLWDRARAELRHARSRTGG